MMFILDADKTWWEALEIFLPWKLSSFTYRSSANFSTSSDMNSIITLTGHQRDQLVTAFRRYYY